MTELTKRQGEIGEFYIWERSHRIYDIKPDVIYHCGKFYFKSTKRFALTSLREVLEVKGDYKGHTRGPCFRITGGYPYDKMILYGMTHRLYYSEFIWEGGVGPPQKN